jgi:hypothetical protein
MVGSCIGYPGYCREAGDWSWTEEVTQLAIVCLLSHLKSKHTFSNLRDQSLARLKFELISPATWYSYHGQGRSATEGQGEEQRQG